MEASITMCSNCSCFKSGQGAVRHNFSKTETPHGGICVLPHHQLSQGDTGPVDETPTGAAGPLPGEFEHACNSISHAFVYVREYQASDCLSLSGTSGQSGSSSSGHPVSVLSGGRPHRNQEHSGRGDVAALLLVLHDGVGLRRPDSLLTLLPLQTADKTNLDKGLIPHFVKCACLLPRLDAHVRTPYMELQPGDISLASHKE